MSRGTRYTPQDKRTFVASVTNAVERGSNLTEACKPHGLSISSYHRWRAQLNMPMAFGATPPPYAAPPRPNGNGNGHDHHDHHDHDHRSNGGSRELTVIEPGGTEGSLQTRFIAVLAENAKLKNVIVALSLEKHGS